MAQTPNREGWSITGCFVKLLVQVNIILIISIMMNNDNWYTITIISLLFIKLFLKKG